MDDTNICNALIYLGMILGIVRLALTAPKIFEAMLGKCNNDHPQSDKEGILLPHFTKYF
jgi:hypothetical protein